MRFLASRRFESFWPGLVTILMLAAFVTSVSPWLNWNEAAKALSQMRGRAGEAGPARPDVLVVSTRDSDRLTVAATVKPRGYTVLLADSIEAGMEQIRQQRDRIGFVVIDAALPHSKQMLRAVAAECPEAYPIMLDGPRMPGQVAILLINRVVRFDTRRLRVRTPSAASGFTAAFSSCVLPSRPRRRLARNSAP
jgi:CheY-like chemotaxis protein